MSQVVSQLTTTSRPRLNKYGYNCVGKHIGMVFGVCAPFFIGAGTLGWDWAWIFTVATLIGWVAFEPDPRAHQSRTAE